MFSILDFFCRQWIQDYRKSTATNASAATTAGQTDTDATGIRELDLETAEQDMENRTEIRPLAEALQRTVPRLPRPLGESRQAKPEWFFRDYAFRRWRGEYDGWAVYVEDDVVTLGDGAEGWLCIYRDGEVHNSLPALNPDKWRQIFGSAPVSIPHPESKAEPVKVKPLTPDTFQA